MNILQRLVFLVLLLTLASCTSAPGPTTTLEDETAALEEEQGRIGSSAKGFSASEQTPEVADTFSDPWPTAFSRVEQTNTALAKSYKFFDTNTSKGMRPELVVLLQPTVPSEYRAALTEAGDALLAAFAPYTQENHVLLIGSSVSWLIEQGDAYNITLPDSLERDGMTRVRFEDWAPTAFPDGEPSGWAHENMAWVGYSELNTEGGLQYILSHELFHSIHLSIDGGQFFEVFPDGDERNSAKWFVEGTASYFGWAIRSWAGGQPYYSPTPTDDRYGMPICPADFTGLSSYESWYSSNAAYDYGQIAVEYLVATTGVETLMGVFESMGTGMPFAEAFEDALSLPLLDFYELFDSHVISKSPSTSQCDA